MFRTRLLPVGIALLILTAIGLAIAFWPDGRSPPRVADDRFYCDTGYPDVVIGIKLPPGDQWEASLVSGDGTPGLPQVVKKGGGLPAVGRVEIHRVEIPDDAGALSLEDKLNNFVAGATHRWEEQRAKPKAGDKLPDGKVGETPPEDGIIALATGTVNTPVMVYGKENPGVTLSVWVIRKTKEQYSQFRVTETMTLIDEGNGKYLLVQFVAQQEQEDKSSYKINMQDSMLPEANGAKKLRPLARLDPALEGVRESLIVVKNKGGQ